MAIFGTIDGKAFANTVAVTQTDATVTKNAADAVEEGDVLELDGVNYIVRTVASTTSIELHKAYAGSTNGTLAAAKVIRRTPPKAVAEYIIKGGDSAASTTELLFVDATEAGLAANKNRGLNGGGWWQYRTYTDVSGRTRHKAELLAAISTAASAAVGDTEDVITADVVNSIAFGTNNANKTTSSGAATFLVAVTVTNSGTASFQWQKRTSATSGRWTNVSGGTSTNLALTGQTAANGGNQYRVKVTSDNGAPEVTSAVATLTFGS